LCGGVAREIPLCFTQNRTRFAWKTAALRMTPIRRWLYRIHTASFASLISKRGGRTQSEEAAETGATQAKYSWN